MGFGKLEPTQRHVAVAMCRDVTILLESEPGFQNFYVIFLSPVDIGCFFVLVLVHFKVNIPPRRGRDQPFWTSMEKEKVILTRNTPASQKKTRVQPEFKFRQCYFQ